MPAKKIQIGSFASAAKAAQGAVVIIDVFRAFTTAAIALHNNAEKIILVDDLDTALAYRAKGIGDLCIGERGGDRPSGFDYGNSPSEIYKTQFDGKTLIQTTSNGTRGILAATQASSIYAGSFITADALVRTLESSNESIVSLIAIGNGDERADEDEVCALYLRSRLLGLAPDHDALVALIRTMSKRMDGHTLSRDDFDLCMKIGMCPFAIKVTRESDLWVARRSEVCANQLSI